jgi:NAD(P)H-hydrate epimerase
MKNKEDILRVILKRKVNSHKGDYGHTLILAGSVGLTGAAYLSSQAALLCGSGLVTLGVPKSLNIIMETKLTEVMTKPLAETKQLTLSLDSWEEISKLIKKVDALAIGPGLSMNPQTQKLIVKLIPSIKKPFVLDADGINAVAKNLAVLRKVKTDMVITPHPREFSRLTDKRVEDIQKNRKVVAQDFAYRYGITLVLKGYRTIVANPRKDIYVNNTGNPGMASGGCGDILTGMIAAFLGQKMEPFKASKLAVYLHGLAGDLASKELGEISLKATDILNKLPEAIKRVHRIH